MMFKFFTLLFILLFITASDPHFGPEVLWVKTPKTEAGDVKEFPWQSTQTFRPYLEDKHGLVSDEFKVSSYYFPTVYFWFLIYTQFESSQVVIHDKSNMGLIYKVLDFTLLHKKKLSKNTLYILQQKLSNEKLSAIEKDFNELIKNPFSLDPRSRSIYRSLLTAGVRIPIKREDRISFFRHLKDNLRTQTGQKNFIRDGIIRSLPYQHFLVKYFEDRGLPKELLAIPFLESSFNPSAESKVNALGAWQFMPLIASYYVPTRTGKIDYRSNVGVASVSAAFLMKENFQILKSWDLAVTAYNSGTKHLLKTKRELSSLPKVNLEAVIKHSDSRHFGFASKNFYSEFLALAHTLAYRDELYPDLHKGERTDIDKDLRFYILKCSLNLSKVLTQAQLEDVLFHNHQITDSKSSMPKGLILTTKTELPTSKFYPITRIHLIKLKPKDWVMLGNQSCSTK